MTNLMILNSNLDLFDWWPDDDLLTGRNWW